MPILKGGPAQVFRCRHCGAPVARDEGSCRHCGQAHPVAAEDGQTVRVAGAASNRDFQAALRDFELARKTLVSWQWRVEAYGIPLGILAFGGLLLALAGTLGRSSPLAWFAIAAALPGAVLFALFRAAAPSIQERHRTWLLFQEQPVRCGVCGRNLVTVPSSSGSVTCDYCGSSLAAVPVEEFIQAARRARQMAASAQVQRRDAQWQASLRAMSHAPSWLVSASLAGMLCLSLASVLVASRGAWLSRPRAPPKVTKLSSGWQCGDCVPMTQVPSSGPQGARLAVLRSTPDAEGLLVFLAGVGPYADPEQCLRSSSGDPLISSQDLFTAAPWSSPVKATADEVSAFFLDTYGPRARLDMRPGMVVGQEFTRLIRISGNEQDWNVYIARCSFGSIAAAIPDEGTSWFALLIPSLLGWVMVAVARARGNF